tara:strand:- start:639 stop:1058 length:420 start_codon:yes stop_codon:yes gene_type:complete
MGTTNKPIVNVHYSTDSKFLGLCSNMTLQSVPNVTFISMLEMNDSINDDGIIINKDNFYKVLNTLEKNKQRPPSQSKSNLNYSDDLKEVLRDIERLTTDSKTGKKKVFSCGHIILRNVRNPEKLKEYQETQKKKKQTLK